MSSITLRPLPRRRDTGHDNFTARIIDHSFIRSFIHLWTRIVKCVSLLNWFCAEMLSKKFNKTVAHVIDIGIGFTFTRGSRPCPSSRRRSPRRAVHVEDAVFYTRCLVLLRFTDHTNVDQWQVRSLQAQPWGNHLHVRSHLFWVITARNGLVKFYAYTNKQ